LRNELNPLRQVVNLEGLDVVTLKQLHVAAAKIGADDPVWVQVVGNQIDAAIDVAMTTRKRKDSEVHKAIPEKVVSALLQNAGSDAGATPIMGAIKMAMEAHLNSPVPGKADLDFELVNHIKNLPPNQRRAIAAAMRQPRIRELRAAVYDVGRTTFMQQHEGIRTELFRIESFFDAIQSAADPDNFVVAEVQRTGPLSKMHADVRRALSMCGVGVGTKENLYTYTQLERAVAESLEAPPAPLPGKAGVLHVARPFYYVGGGNNRPRAELGQYLRTLCQDDQSLSQALDANLLDTFHDVTGQVIDGMRQLLASVNSPIQLPDGTPVDVMGNVFTTFRIRRDDKLGLVVSCELRIDAIRGEVRHPTPRTIRLQGSAGMNCEIALTPGRAAHVAAPPSFINEIEEIPSWGENPVPRNINDLSQPDAPQRLVHGFQEHADREVSGENFAFLRAVDSLPTDDAQALVEIQRIADSFIAADSRFQVNISADQRRTALADLHRLMTAQPPDLKQIRAVLLVVRDEVVKLAGYDTLNRFVKGLDKTPASNVAAPTAATAQEIPAPPLTEDEQRESGLRATKINQSLVLLASIGAPLDVLGKNAASLGGKAGEPLVELTDFREHVHGFLQRMARRRPDDLAALRYQLERVIPENLRASEHVQVVIEEAIKVQEMTMGPRARRMTAEALYLELAPPALDSRHLVGWFVQARVSQAEVASFFKRVFDDGLKLKLAAISEMSRQQVPENMKRLLVETGERVLAVRKEARNDSPRARSGQNTFPRSSSSVAVAAPSGANITPVGKLDGPRITHWILAKRVRPLVKEDLPILVEMAQLYVDPTAPEREVLVSNLGFLVERMPVLLEELKAEAWTYSQLQELASALLSLKFDAAPLGPVMARHPERLRHIGNEFVTLADGWTPGVTLMPADLPTVKSLAALFKGLKPDDPNEPFAPGVPESAMKRYEKLRGSLENLMTKFNGQGWTPDELEGLLTDLDSLGVESSPVHIAIMNL
jgi:hypothetical protein